MLVSTDVVTNMNTHNEEKWDETDAPDGLKKMNELEDLATGFFGRTDHVLYALQHSQLRRRAPVLQARGFTQKDRRTLEGCYYLQCLLHSL
jgi:hypothetical protein